MIINFKTNYMKKLALLLFLIFPLIAGAQNIRIQQLRSTGEPAGRIVITDGSDSFEYADLTASGSVDSVKISGNTLEVYGNGSATPFTVDLSPYLDNTDAQKFDVATLAGTVLQLSLSGDGEATKTIDLSSLQDGTGTDSQTLSFTSPNLAISGGNSVDLTPLQDGTGTDDQTASEVPVTVQNGIEQANVQLELEAIREDMASGGDGWGTDVVSTDTTLDGDGTALDVLGVADNAISYALVSDSLKGGITDNDGAWDYSVAGVINAAISSNTTVTFSNLQLNKQLKIRLTLSSGATITWPAYVTVQGAELSDGTFKLYADCWGSGSGTEDVLINIIAE